MAEDKVRCSIDIEEEWIQEGCHWKLTRLVYFTFKILDTSLTNISFSYKLGNAADVTITPINNKYILNLSELLDTISNSPETYLDEDQNFLTISTKATAGTTTLGSASYDYWLKLAPRVMPNLDIALEYVTERPGEVECSWMDYWENTGDKYLKGYSVEMFYRPAGESDFVKVGFLKWDEKKFEDDPYYHYIIKDTELEKSTNDYINNCATAEDETVYMNLLPGSELYLEQADFFWFRCNPRELGVNPGDEYEFRIYPYNAYCSHFVHDDEGNICGTDISALLANEGVLSGDRKVPKGIVRVKVGNDWKEGQVWVMKDGQWKEAQAVYVMNEGIWKEAK